MDEATNGKAEIIKNTPVVPYDEDTQLVTYVKAEVDGEKNGIVFDVPNTDEEAQERYNCSLAFLTRQGVRNLSHHVTYDGSHEAMQAAADAYKCGQRGTGAGRKTIKKVESERDAALAIALKVGEDNGMTEEAIKAMVAEYQATA